MTVAMLCLREPPPRDEQPMMAARALATLRAHFVRPTRRLRRGRIPAIAATATATMALHTVRGVLIFPFIVDFSCCGFWVYASRRSLADADDADCLGRPVGLAGLDCLGLEGADLELVLSLKDGLVRWLVELALS